MLINQLVWAPKPRNLNDPFDIQVPYSDAVPTVETFLKLVQKIERVRSEDDSSVRAMIKTAAEYERFSDTERKKLMEDAKVPDEEIENWGIYSLSACYDEPEDILMWAHYADSHKGFIVGFDTSSLSPMEEGDRGSVFPVVYEDKLEPININEDPTFFKRLYLKSKVWTYEQEYRLIYEHGDTHQNFPVKLASITFGLKMNPLHIVTIRRALANLENVEYYRTIQPEGELIIRYEPVDSKFFNEIRNKRKE